MYPSSKAHARIDISAHLSQILDLLETAQRFDRRRALTLHHSPRRTRPEPTVIDVTPLAREQLRLHSPAGDVREFEKRVVLGRQVLEDSQELIEFEESLPHVVLRQHR